MGIVRSTKYNVQSATENKMYKERVENCGLVERKDMKDMKGRE